jgi:GntR family transcriptional regulator
MQIHLDPGDGVPIYRQIVQQVKYLVAAGRLRPGEELPPIRALAERLVINPNTVARAYRELERDGVVTKRSTTGTFVSALPAGPSRADCLAALLARVDALLAEARPLGVEVDELCELVHERHRKMRASAGGNES